MKIMRLSVIALVSLAVTAAADAGEMSFGFKGGLMMANVTGVPDEWEDVQTWRNSMCGGIFLNYAFDEALSIQPELLYMPKGVGVSLDYASLAADATAAMDFIELPVLLKYTFRSGSGLRPCIFAGPSIAFAVDSKLDIDIWWFSTDIDISDYTNDTDFSLVAGAGVGYETKYGILTFDARFQRGFANVMEDAEFEIDDETYSISVDEYKHYGFAFMAGWQF